MKNMLKKLFNEVYVNEDGEWKADRVFHGLMGDVLGVTIALIASFIWLDINIWGLLATYILVKGFMGLAKELSDDLRDTGSGFDFYDLLATLIPFTPIYVIIEIKKWFK